MLLFLWCEYFLDSFKYEVVITSIMNLNKPGKDESVIRFDFSTLNTKIPHSKLLTDFCFDGESQKSTHVCVFGAIWIAKPDSYPVVSDKCSFKKAIKFVLDNCF